MFFILHLMGLNFYDTLWQDFLPAIKMKQYQSLRARPQCINNGDTTILH